MQKSFNYSRVPAEHVADNLLGFRNESIFRRPLTKSHRVGQSRGRLKVKVELPRVVEIPESSLGTYGGS